MKRHALLGTGAGLLLTALVTLVFRSTALDIDLQALAWVDAPGNRWPHAAEQPWKMLHDYGTVPGVLFALLAIAAATASFLHSRFVAWRFPALYVIALTALGPGLVTNILGKIFAGRPRPEEIVEFGGTMPFLRPFELGTPGRGFSFLCGHCSMGFLFFALFFLPGVQRRWTWLLLATFYGLLLGVARVADGAHFPSDILLEGTILFTLAAALAPLAWRTPQPVRRSRLAVIAGGALAVLLVAAFLVSLPIHEQRTRTWMDRPARRAGTGESLALWPGAHSFHLRAERGDVTIRFAGGREALVVHSIVKGFGFPGSGGKSDVESRGRELHLRHELEGFLWEARPAFDVVVHGDTELQRLVVHTDGVLRVEGRGLKRPLTIRSSRGCSGARRPAPAALVIEAVVRDCALVPGGVTPPWADRGTPPRATPGSPPGSRAAP